MFGDTIWSILVIVGPIVLLAALAFAMLRNRTTSRQDAETAAATKRNYAEQSAEDDAAAR